MNHFVLGFPLPSFIRCLFLTNTMVLSRGPVRRLCTINVWKALVDNPACIFTIEPALSWYSSCVGQFSLWMLSQGFCINVYRRDCPIFFPSNFCCRFCHQGDANCIRINNNGFFPPCLQNYGVILMLFYPWLLVDSPTRHLGLKFSRFMIRFLFTVAFTILCGCLVVLLQAPKYGVLCTHAARTW